MILHVLSPLLDSFTLPFIKFMDDNGHLIEGTHRYLFICRPDQIEGGIEGNRSHSFLNGSVEFSHPDDGMSRVLRLMQESEKVIIHGLWREKINDLLVEHVYLLKKSYWFMYGGDYFHKNTYSENHIKVIRAIAYIVTDIDANIEFVRREYGAKGKHLRSFSYTSNVCRHPYADKKESPTLRIMLGHCGIEDNKHLKYLNELSLLKDKATIYCPLSYPNRNEYINKVVDLGHKLFGERFKPLLDFMPKATYENFLSEKIDIAICASWRTHGLGNITTLLTSGAKVYLDKNVTSWKWFSDIGVKLFTLEEFDAELKTDQIAKMDVRQAQKNSDIMLNYFSEDNLLRSLNNIWAL
jgi:dTDP-N-acetylfucosamine:lipid II N-acetylfucosaminyltransferase